MPLMKCVGWTIFTVVNRLFYRVAALAATLAAFSARATVYYVATNGVDTNAGTSLSVPFKSIQHAAQVAVAGDTCFICTGTYHGTLAPSHSGTSSARITFAAYQNESVIIDAADAITAWSPYNASIYQAPAGWTLGPGFDEVFVDGAMIHQAQIPAYGSGDVLHPSLASVSIGTVISNTITSATWSGQPDNYWVGAWFVGGVGLSWAWQTALITNSSGNSITVDPTTETPGVWWFTGSGKGYLFGNLNMLSSDNQWFLQTNSGNSILFLRITGGESPSSHLVEMKRRLWCVDLNGHNYITVSGLNTWGGAIRLTGNGNILQNCQAQYLSHYTILSPNYSENDGVEQGDGVEINGTSNTVTGCTIGNTAGCGIYSSGSNNVITRNLIYNTDYSGSYACAIALHGDQEKVLFNTLRDAGRDVLRPEGTGSDIRFNDLSFPGLLCKDLGLIYVWGTDAMDAAGVTTRVAYNWVHDNDYPLPAAIIYLDNYDAKFIIDHNVCWNSGGDSGVRINGPAIGHIICNNTVFNCADVGAFPYDSWPSSNPNPSFWTNDVNQYLATNNLYLGSSPQSELADWTNDNFSLLSNAAAIDAGVVLPGFTDGYVGKNPDLGAYEYGGPVWQAGTNARPSLVIVSQGPGGLKVSASPDAAFFTLYSATNLAPSATWTRVTNTPTFSDDVWYMTLYATNAAAYYQLQSQ